ncbi:MAG: serine/threonine protein kinase [Gordonia sp.]|nr:serine/threonine protein kinase [Gordonia sp. (in: high G+C Gram-positive bacteria)]OZG30823.1 fructosamine kinase [Williamsia sp. 1138]
MVVRPTVIRHAGRVTTAEFVKRRPGAHPDFFAAEAAGLRWLGDAGAPVVQVLEVSAEHITLERVASAAPTPVAAEEFGAALARMHDAGAAEFGSPPAGFDGQLFIGSRAMPSEPKPTWGEFYAVQRVLAFVDIAVSAGNLTHSDAEDTRAACELIASGLFDDDEPAARIHGDLWSGNVMWTPKGVVMIDPAAHGGHRETDLAMLALFGCPEFEAVIDGYQRAHRLRAGWQDRIPLHQLHPLAVHAAGHGPGYGTELGRAARRTLELAA